MSPLLPTQLSRLERKLNQSEAAALARIRTAAGQRIDEPYSTLRGEVSDLADAASADLLVDIDNAFIGIELQELKDIAAAKLRIKNQIYGICTDCKLPIDYARLHAYPTAKRCTICQGIHEHTYTGSDHASI